MQYKKLIENPIQIGRFTSNGDLINVDNPNENEKAIVKRMIELRMIAEVKTLEEVKQDVNNLIAPKVEEIDGLTFEEIKEKFTVKELKALAKGKIKGSHLMNEDTLIEALIELNKGE
jgi:hypothetical protein